MDGIRFFGVTQKPRVVARGPRTGDADAVAPQRLAMDRVRPDHGWDVVVDPAATKPVNPEVTNSEHDLDVGRGHVFHPGADR